MRTIHAIQLVVAMLCLNAGAWADTSTKVIDVGNNPEGSIPYGGYVFVSNLGATRSPLRDGDGYISKMALDGSSVEQRFLPRPGDFSLNFPMGMVAVSDILYVVDINRVVGFSIATRRIVFESVLDVEGLEYLNDIEYVGPNSLVVSATNLKKLYHLNFETRKWTQLETDADLGLVNGLFSDRVSQNLYVVHNQKANLENGNGTITSVKLAFADAFEPTKLLPTNWEIHVGRFLDGIDMIGRNTLMVSDWNDLTVGGAVHLINIERQSLIRSEMWGQLGLADISYDRSRDVVVLPSMLKSQVELISQKWTRVTQLNCRSTGEGVGSINLGVDEFGILRDAQVNGQQCLLPHSTEGDGRIWHETFCGLSESQKPLDILATQTEGQKAILLEISFPRDPQEECEHQNPRLCNPSRTGYSYYWCQ